MVRKPRIKDDAYYTRAASVVDLLWRTLHTAPVPAQISSYREVFDPCVGEGHIEKATRAFFGYKCDPIAHPAATPKSTQDATQDVFWDELCNFYGTVGLESLEIVTNPPYQRGTCEAIIGQALNRNLNVAALLRLSWLEPCTNRVNLLANHADRLLYVIPISPRVQFRTDTTGNDSVTVAWYCWRRNWSWAAVAVTPPFVFSRHK